MFLIYISKNIEYPLDGGTANIISKLCFFNFCAMDLTTEVITCRFAPANTN